MIEKIWKKVRWGFLSMPELFQEKKLYVSYYGNGVLASLRKAVSSNLFSKFSKKIFFFLMT